MRRGVPRDETDVNQFRQVFLRVRLHIQVFKGVEWEWVRKTNPSERGQTIRGWRHGHWHTSRARDLRTRFFLVGRLNATGDGDPSIADGHGVTKSHLIEHAFNHGGGANNP